MLTGIALIAASAASSWTVIDPPQPGLSWHCTSMVQQQWSARVTGDKLLFSPRVPEAKNRDLVWSIGKRGQLVGRNRGLAGGALEWVTDAGKQRRTLLDINPVAFAEHRGDIFDAAGQSHRVLGDGSIYRLRSGGGRDWQIEKVLDLEEAPLAAYARNGSWFLVTVMGVTRLDLHTLETTRLHRNMQWWQLDPSSIVEHRGRWYIGARRGVIRLTRDSQGYREQWMVPSDCKTFAGDCECSS
jgi:hypothetical protein